MKKVVTVSLGSSRKDFEFKTTFLGQDFSVHRMGADQDTTKAWELMRRQQDLMDQTQRMPGGESGPLDQEGDDPGNRSGNMGSEGLAGEQGNIGRMLEQFMKQLGQNGLQAPPSFGEGGGF